MQVSAILPARSVSYIGVVNVTGGLVGHPDHAWVGARLAGMGRSGRPAVSQSIHLDAPFSNRSKSMAPIPSFQPLQLQLQLQGPGGREGPQSI